jgi:hypothetical protein
MFIVGEAFEQNLAGQGQCGMRAKSRALVELIDLLKFELTGLCGVAI